MGDHPAPSTAWLAWGLATLVMLVGIYDLWVQTRPDNGSLTVSEYIYGLAGRHPVVPFLFGLLMGHLFWRKG